MDWQETRWSMILASAAGRREALAELCRMYRPAVIELARSHGLLDPEDAAQDFFAHIIERDFFATADRERGRFRGYLRGAFREFVRNRKRHEAALRRGGADTDATVSIEDDQVRELASSEDLFTLTWARSLVAHATEALAWEYHRRGREHRFAIMRPFLFREPREGEYARLAPQAGLTATSLSTSIARMRERHYALITGLVAETTATSEDEAQELQELAPSLAKLVQSSTSAHKQ